MLAVPFAYYTLAFGTPEEIRTPNQDILSIFALPVSIQGHWCRRQDSNLQKRVILSDLPCTNLATPLRHFGVQGGSRTHKQHHPLLRRAALPVCLPGHIYFHHYAIVNVLNRKNPGQLSADRGSRLVSLTHSITHYSQQREVTRDQAIA